MLSNDFKILDIKDSRDFRKISSSKVKFISKTSIVISCKTQDKYLFNQPKGLNAQNFCRIGYTVSKKVSKLAVKRNQAKRRLREAFRKLAQKYCKNHQDYVIIARPQIIDSDFNTIKRDLEFCLTNLVKKCN
jgi:ribonuclease P protein component